MSRQSHDRARIKRINRFYLPGKVAFVDQRSLPAGGKTSGEMPLDERAGSPRAAQRLSLLARSREKKPHSRTSRGARLFALRSVRPSVRPLASGSSVAAPAHVKESTSSDTFALHGSRKVDKGGGIITELPDRSQSLDVVKILNASKGRSCCILRTKSSALVEGERYRRQRNRLSKAEEEEEEERRRKRWRRWRTRRQK